jgi:hypothetical protein
MFNVIIHQFIQQYWNYMCHIKVLKILKMEKRNIILEELKIASFENSF